MKRGILCLFAVLVFCGCNSLPQSGIVTDKAIDPPRSIRYPFVGRVDINKEPIYWFRVDDLAWVPVSQEDFVSHQEGWLWAAWANE